MGSLGFVKIKPTVWAFNEDAERKGILGILSGDALLKESDLGTFTFDVDMRSPLADRISAGWFVSVNDGYTKFSGIVESIEAKIEANEQTVTITGVCDVYPLRDRLTYPNPFLDADKQDVARYVIRGDAETVIKSLVNLSCGPGALPYRQSPGFTIEPNAKQGGQVSISERFTNVLEVAKSVARLGGVSFWAYRDEDGKVIFRVRTNRDLSRQVRFNARTGGGATGSMKVESATVTAAIVAGQGEGAERYINEKSIPARRRIEALKDRRDTDEADVVEQAANELLKDGAASASANTEISETNQRIFDRDFTLGDTVTIQMGSVKVSRPVRAANISWDAFGRTVKLAVGDHDTADDKAPAWVSIVNEMNAKIRRLEASK